MEIALARLSAFALRVRPYLPVWWLALAVIGFVKGFNPLDIGGGTGG